MTKISALTEAAVVADEDSLVLVQGGSTKHVHALAVKTYTGQSWDLIAASRYTALPPTTSRINFDSGASALTGIQAGSPIQYSYSGNTYYGSVRLVHDVADPTKYINIVGAALSTGAGLTSLKVGPPERLLQIPFFIPGSYEGSTGDKLASVADQYFRWLWPAAYLVFFQATHKTPAGAAEPWVNVMKNGTAVFSSDSGQGAQMDGSAGGWTQPNVVGVNTAVYRFAKDDNLEIRCTVIGGGTDALDLTLLALFVFEE